MTAVPAAPAQLVPAESVLLVARPRRGRILILSIDPCAPVVRLRLARGALTPASAGLPVLNLRTSDMWSIARDCVSLGLAVAIVGGLGSTAAATAENAPRVSIQVNGGLVDGDLPALYRLPSVASDIRIARVADAPPAPRIRPTNKDSQLDTPSFANKPTRRQPTKKITPLALEPAPTFPYAANTAELSVQLLPAVQRGYALAQRGAISAAQTEFIQVLRRIAQAKDIQHRTDKHSRALAAGLRALDEAEDFVPAGIQLEAELDVRIVASSHRTPVLGDHSHKILPHEAVARYHHFAHEQLALAVGDEQAGSMVLHGLGKVYVRLAERDDDLQASRTAMTLYLAALAVCPMNHLAANELGVLLCRNGHAAEAAALFEQTIDFAPSATAYHNLAVAQQKLGLHGPAAANEQESQRLAAWERARGAVSRRVGVEWVTPAEMAGVVQPGVGVSASVFASPSGRGSELSSGEGPPRSAWQRTVGLAKSLPLPGRSAPTQWR